MRVLKRTLKIILLIIFIHYTSYKIFGERLIYQKTINKPVSNLDILIEQTNHIELILVNTNGFSNTKKTFLKSFYKSKLFKNKIDSVDFKFYKTQKELEQEDYYDEIPEYGIIIETNYPKISHYTNYIRAGSKDSLFAEVDKYEMIWFFYKWIIVKRSGGIS